MRHRGSVLAFACTAALASGCIPLFDTSRPVVMDVLMFVVAGAEAQLVAPLVAAPAKRQKLTAELTVETTVTIGGLDGTYDVTLGPYGHFAGTAKVIGKKRAKLVDDGSPELLAAVHGIVLDALAADVTVSEAKAKVSGKQTTGGVHKRYKGRIKFKGTLAAGASVGAGVKGKISTKGDLEA